MVYGTVDSSTGAATGGDVATFRTVFGVPGTLNMHVYHGYGTVACTDPGTVSGDEFEASLDAEWASALAPSANLIFMSCATNSEQGVFNSMAALIDNNLSDVMSLSYGTSELNYTASRTIRSTTICSNRRPPREQSVVVSTGDSGSDVLTTARRAHPRWVRCGARSSLSAGRLRRAGLIPGRYDYYRQNLAELLLV